MEVVAETQPITPLDAQAKLAQDAEEESLQKIKADGPEEETKVIDGDEEAEEAKALPGPEDLDKLEPAGWMKFKPAEDTSELSIKQRVLNETYSECMRIINNFDNLEEV